MKEAVFISYKNGYFKFLFESGEDMVFDDVHPRVLKQFDLKNDTSFIGKSFKISFLEVIENSEQDAVIYRIESLKPV